MGTFDGILVVYAEGYWYAIDQYQQLLTPFGPSRFDWFEEFRHALKTGDMILPPWIQYAADPLQAVWRLLVTRAA